MSSDKKAKSGKNNQPVRSFIRIDPKRVRGASAADRPSLAAKARGNPRDNRTAGKSQDTGGASPAGDAQPRAASAQPAAESSSEVSEEELRAVDDLEQALSEEWTISEQAPEGAPRTAAPDGEAPAKKLQPTVVADPDMSDRLTALQDRVTGVATEQQELKEAAENLKSLESKLSNLAQLSELLSARYNPFLVREAADEFEGDILRELVEPHGQHGREIVNPERPRAVPMPEEIEHARGPPAPEVDHLPPTDPEALERWEAPQVATLPHAEAPPLAGGAHTDPDWGEALDAQPPDLPESPAHSHVPPSAGADEYDALAMEAEESRGGPLGAATAAASEISEASGVARDAIDAAGHDAPTESPHFAVPAAPPASAESAASTAAPPAAPPRKQTAAERFQHAADARAEVASQRRDEAHDSLFGPVGAPAPRKSPPQPESSAPPPQPPAASQVAEHARQSNARRGGEPIAMRRAANRPPPANAAWSQAMPGAPAPASPTWSPRERNWELERAHIALRWFEHLLSSDDPYWLYYFLDRFESLGWLDARLYNWLRELAEGIAPPEEVPEEAPEMSRSKLLALHQTSLRFVEKLSDLQAQERHAGGR